MSNFPEPTSPAFVPVYQLKRTDAVDAGAAGDGPSNLPLKNLVERTAYLKKEVDDLDTALDGVVIGSTVQAYDADLAAIAALTTTGLIARTGAGTAAIRTTGATGLNVLAAADAATARAAIAAQEADADLAAIAALTTTGLIARTGAGTAAIRTTGATGLNVLASADEETARAAIEAQKQFELKQWTPSYWMNTSGSVQPLTATGEFLLIPPDFVWVSLAMSSSSLNSPEGVVRITLPFPGGYPTPVAIRAQSWGSTVTYLQGVVASNSTVREFITLFKHTPNQIDSPVTAFDLSSVNNGNVIQASVLYRRYI